jgi:hypothetical protein
MNACADDGAVQCISAIRPIYGSTDLGRPEHIGTCIFLDIDKNKYLLTAAHVIDENQHTSLYVGGDKKLVLIEGDFTSTEKPGDDRNKDHYDFAYLLLKDGLLKKLGNIDFFNETAISENREDTTGRLYLALGYPVSKNKKSDPSAKMVQPHYLKYSSTIKTNTVLCQKLGISGKDHLFLGHDSKYSRDSEGTIVNTIAPKGISGGALVDMGNIARPEQLKDNIACKGRLAGLLIENHKEHKSTVAVKISLIIEAIKRDLPVRQGVQ